MAEFAFYVDTDRGENVTSNLDGSIKDLPPFVLGDSLPMRISLLQDFNQTSSYTQIPTLGRTVQVALGDLETGTIYAAQYAWTPDEDGLSFSAVFAMNTSELASALDGETSIEATFEIKVIESAVPRTVLQKNVTIRKALISQDSLVPVPVPNYLSAEAATAMFVRLIEDRPHYLEGAAGTLLKVWNDDSTGTATFKADNEA